MKPTTKTDPRDARIAELEAQLAAAVPLTAADQRRYDARLAEAKRDALKAAFRDLVSADKVVEAGAELLDSGDAWARRVLLQALSPELVIYFLRKSSADVRAAALDAMPSDTRKALEIGLIPQSDLKPHVRIDRGFESRFSKSCQEGGVMVSEDDAAVLLAAGLDVRRVGSTIKTEGLEYRGLFFPTAPEAYLEMSRQAWEVVLRVDTDVRLAIEKKTLLARDLTDAELRLKLRRELTR